MQDIDMKNIKTENHDTEELGELPKCHIEGKIMNRNTITLKGALTMEDSIKPMEKTLYTVKEAAKYYGMSKSSIYKLIKK